jgi:LPXTG-motif cell wall-anchored protein
MAILAAPSAALAQSAGDEQYQDPFGGNDQSQSSDQGTSSGSEAGTTAQATPTPAGTTETATAQKTVRASKQLPRTGDDPITPAVAGFWLLLGGVALRARVRLHDRRP